MILWIQFFASLLFLYACIRLIISAAQLHNECKRLYQSDKSDDDG